MSDDRLKLIFGFVLLLILAALAMGIAWGKVEENSSFGLREIITGLLTLAGGFVGWAFGSRGGKDKGE